MNKKIIGFLLTISFLLCFLLMPNPVQGSTAYTITGRLEAQDVRYDNEVTYQERCTFLKMNVSSIPAGYFVENAILNISLEQNTGDGDMLIFGILNQTWVASHSEQGSDLMDMATHTQTLLNGITGIGWTEIDITSIFRANYNQGLANITVRLEDPDEAMSENAGQTLDSLPILTNGRFGNTWVANPHFDTDEWTGGTAPKLHVTLGTAQGNSFYVQYDFSGTDRNSWVVPDEFWNGTKLLYRLPLYPYEDSTNITIVNIPTTYTLAFINPNATYDSTDLTDGIIILTGLFEGTYEIFFDPSQDLKTLHISLFAPDGVGLMWESFQIYINNTRVPYPPSYKVEVGSYEFSVKDYFEQTVFSGSFTTYESDPPDIYQNWEVPLYKVSFHNGDIAPYRVEITRNSITRKHPVPPKGDAFVRLYGLASNVPYSVEIYHTETGELMDSYTLNVPNAPVGRYMNYDNDEQIDFPSYAWIQESLKVLQGQMVSQNQLVILIGVGLFITVIVQTQGILKNLLQKPLVKRGKPK